MITGILSDALAGSGVAQPLTMSLLIIDLVGNMSIVSFFIGSYYWQREQDSLTNKGEA
jgi:hypothetical protein